MNRLNLDFSLNTSEERIAYINKYLKEIQFTPNESESSKISDYILWGNKQSKKNDDIYLPSRWNDNPKIESYEALLESPAFNESQIVKDRPQTKFKKEVFSREEVRQKAPQSIIPQFEYLWRQIDETDLVTCLYEIETGKRTKPPRAELLNRFEPEEINELASRAKNLTQRHYLKLRHELIDLRRDQYILRDTYKKPQLQPIPTHYSPSFELDLKVYPAGTITENKKYFEFSSINDFTEEEIRKILQFIYSKKDPLYFDFREENHITSLLENWDFLTEDAEQNPDSTSAPLLKTFEFYARHAKLKDFQREILQLKIQKVRNEDIINIINPKYHKTYNPNYISTIFHKKIIIAITDAAKEHFEVLSNLCFPENFKTCSKCGKTLLLNKNNFIRKAKSKDGFAARCKCCEKEERDKRGK